MARFVLFSKFWWHIRYIFYYNIILFQLKKPWSTSFLYINFYIYYNILFTKKKVRLKRVKNFSRFLSKRKKKKHLDDKSRLNFPELEKCSRNVLKIGSNGTIQLESVVMRHRSRQITTHAITLPLSVPIQATPSWRIIKPPTHHP